MGWYPNAERFDFEDAWEECVLFDTTEGAPPPLAIRFAAFYCCWAPAPPLLLIFAVAAVVLLLLSIAELLLLLFAWVEVLLLLFPPDPYPPPATVVDMLFTLVLLFAMPSPPS